MTVERHFARVFAFGELLLTLTLISGIYHSINALTAENIHKALFHFLLGLSLASHFLVIGKKDGMEKG